MSENNEKKTMAIKDIENPALVYAMYEMKEKKTKEAEAKFISELRKAIFISPAIVEVKGEDGEFRVAKDSSEKGDTRIQFMMLTSDKKEIFLPAFTSLDELNKWKKEQMQTVVCRFDNYINIICSDPNGPKGIAIDPFGSNILLSRELLEGLKAAVDAQKNSQVYIADLKERPEELENTLTDFFNEDGSVKAAYLQLMRRGENNVSLLLIVDHDIPEGASEDEVKALRKELFDRIAAVSKPALKGMAFSIAGFTDDFGKKAVDNKSPFYTR